MSPVMFYVIVAAISAGLAAMGYARKNKPLMIVGLVFLGLDAFFFVATSWFARALYALHSKQKPPRSLTGPCGLLQ